jgi:TolB-like protein/DNA-binding winged helix-turn-helix (wHTH) protein/tetratricopeptide (TPR) repeat protein
MKPGLFLDCFRIVFGLFFKDGVFMQETNETIETVYEFGQFRLSPAEHLLLRDEQPVPLPPKVFDTLVALVESGGRLIEKDELLQKIWADTFVEEGTLARNISLLRKTLGEAGTDGQKYIETVPKRGYRFVEPVRKVKAVEETAETPEISATENLIEKSPENPVVEKRTAEPKTPDKTRRTLLWLLLVFGIVGALFTSLSFWNSPPQQIKKQQLSRIKSIAVLPFKPIGNGDESLELGMADALITRLSNVREIVVRPTATIAKYQETAADAAQIGRDLQVEAVLVGSIQRAGDRVRVTAQLVNASDGSPLWADTFDARFTDIFAVQDSISAQVASALAAQLSGDERARLSKRPTGNSEAYALYLKGHFLLNKRTAADRRKAIEYFEQAIALDPNFAEAHAGLADCYVLGGSGTGEPVGEVMTKAKQSATRALEIDSALAEARVALGAVKLIYDWDFEAAEIEFDRALESNPNLATAHRWRAEYLFVRERREEAIAAMKKAHELDPTSLILSRDVGRAFYLARQPDRAIEQYRRTLEMDADFHPAIFYLGLAYEQKGMFAEAVAELEKADRLAGGRALTKATLAFVYAKSGRAEEARKTLAELENQSPPNKAPSFDLAIIHAGLGETDKAFDALEKAFAERSYRLIYLKSDPIFDSLRGDSRFQNLLRRIGLE